MFVCLSHRSDAAFVAQQQIELSALIDSKLVYALKNIQLDRIKLEVEMHKELYDIEKKYHSKLVEFDAKRAAIVKGEKVPTEEECEYPYRDPDCKPVDPPADQKGIPNFWATILHNLEMFNDMVQLPDEPILEKLTDIRCVLLSNPDVRFYFLYLRGRKLTFFLQTGLQAGV